MTLLSPHSPHTTGRRRSGSRVPAAATLCAGALVLMAGCGAAGSAGSAGTTGPTRSAAPLSPQKALSLAAEESRRVNSMSATLSEHIASAGSVHGRIQMRLKPTLLADVNLSTSIGGQATTIHEIVAAKALYLKNPSGQPGKPWIEIRLSDLRGSVGQSLQSLLQSAQSSNPAEQTQMLAASKNVHKVGTQVVSGVQTTHFAGTVSVSAALRSLPPKVRKGFKPVMKLISGAIRFDVWIDAQHVARKFAEVETVSGHTVTVTLNVTSVNQPVQITLPPASKVAILPAKALSGL